MTRRSRKQPVDPVAAQRQAAMTTLGEVLSSKVRATLLAWSTARLETRFSLTELSQATGVAISSLQHECYKLERLGVLDGRREGASRRYAVDLQHPLSRPLVNLVVATLGLQRVLADALGDLGTLEEAFLAGPGPDGKPAGLTLVMIGELGLEGLGMAQERVALLLATEPERIELAYFSPDDWADGDGHPFRERLAGRPIQPIIDAEPTEPAA